MTRKRGFTLVELLTVVGIIAAVGGVVVPVVGKAIESSSRVRCAANLRQIGIALQTYRIENGAALPTRSSGLDQTNPHVLKYKGLPDSVATTMFSLAGTKDIFYCPGNPQNRSPSTWWAYTSGTIAATYQFPFWLKSSLWLTPRPNYRRPAATTVIAADYLGADETATAPMAWNHKLSGDGSPQGMNMLFGDGHVEWRNGSNGWVNWGRSSGPLNWFWAN